MSPYIPYLVHNAEFVICQIELVLQITFIFPYLGSKANVDSLNGVFNCSLSSLF